MKAVLLAAGRGRRMGNITDAIPKPLIRLRGKPLIVRTMEVLPNDIDECIVVIGYRGFAICEYLGDRWLGRRITYVQQQSLSGTAGALCSAKDALRGTSSFLVVTTDDLYRQDELNRLTASRAPSFGVSRRPVDVGAGSVCFTAHGVLTAIQGSVSGRYAYVGVGAYHLTQAYFDHTPAMGPNGEWSLPHTLLKLDSVRIVPFRFWHQINRPHDLSLALERLQE